MFCFGLVLGGITVLPWHRGTFFTVPVPSRSRCAVMVPQYHAPIPRYTSYGTCQQIRTAVQKPRSFQPLQRRYIPAKNQFIDRVRSLSYRVNKLEVFKLNADDLSLLCCLLWLLTAEARLMLWRCAITQVLMCHLAPFSHNILASQTDTNIT